MDKELKEKWLTALRSGNYAQTKCWLHNHNGYCCLGVLAECQGAFWSDEHGGDFGGTYQVPMKDGNQMGRSSIFGSAYLKDEYAGGLSYKDQKHLSMMNDRGDNFNTIANYIEENL